MFYFLCQYYSPVVFNTNPSPHDILIDIPNELIHDRCLVNSNFGLGSGKLGNKVRSNSFFTATLIWKPSQTLESCIIHLFLSVYKCLHKGMNGARKYKPKYRGDGESSRQFGSDCHQLIDIDKLDPALQLLCRFMEYIRYLLVSPIIRADTFILLLFQDILSPNA